MAKFHDLLLEELKRRQVPDRTSARKRRRRVALPMLAGAAGLAMAGVLAVALLGLSVLFHADTQAAYAVTAHPDGSVTVTLHDLTAIKPANKALRARHLRIELVRTAASPAAPVRGCPPTSTATFTTRDEAAVPAGWLQRVGPDGVRIWPQAIPPDTTLILQARPADGNSHDSARLDAYWAVTVSCGKAP
jgi:hypothetical protein